MNNISYRDDDEESATVLPADWEQVSLNSPRIYPTCPHYVVPEDVTLDRDNTVPIRYYGRGGPVTYIVDSARGTGKTRVLIEDLVVAPYLDSHKNALPPPRILFCASSRYTAIWIASEVRRRIKAQLASFNDRDVAEHFEHSRGFPDANKDKLLRLRGSLVVTSPEYFWLLSDLDAAGKDLPISHGYDIVILDDVDEILNTIGSAMHTSEVAESQSKFKRCMSQAQVVAITSCSMLNEATVAKIRTDRPKAIATTVFLNRYRLQHFSINNVPRSQLLQTVTRCVEKAMSSSREALKKPVLFVGTAPLMLAAFDLVNRVIEQKRSIVQRMFNSTKHQLRSLLLTEQTFAVPSMRGIFSLKRDAVIEKYRGRVEFLRYPGGTASKYDFVLLSIPGLDLAGEGGIAVFYDVIALSDGMSSPLITNLIASARGTTQSSGGFAPIRSFIEKPKRSLLTLA